MKPTIKLRGKTIITTGRKMTKRKALLYVIIFPDDKLYVGITINTLRRCLTDHFSKARRRCRNSLHNAFNRYEREAIKTVVLHRDLSWEDIQGLDVRWIDRLGALSPDGYNFTEGGKGTLGMVPSDETIAKLTGQTRTAEMKARISEGAKTRAATPEGKLHHKTIQAASKTPEARAKQGRALAAYAATPEGKAAKSKQGRAYAATPKGKAHCKAMNAASRTPEARAKISKAATARKATPEGKAQTAIFLTAAYTPETIQKRKNHVTLKRVKRVAEIIKKYPYVIGLNEVESEKKGRVILDCQCLSCGDVRLLEAGNLKHGKGKRCRPCANKERAMNA